MTDEADNKKLYEELFTVDANAKQSSSPPKETMKITPSSSSSAANGNHGKKVSEKKDYATGFLNLMDDDDSDEEEDEEDSDEEDVEADGNPEKKRKLENGKAVPKPRRSRGVKSKEAKRRKRQRALERKKKMLEGKILIEGEEGEAISVSLPKVFRDYKRRVFITNIPFTVLQEDIRKLMADVGEVKHIKWARDPVTEKFCGYCFISFATEQQADEAIARYNGWQLSDRWLVAKRCKEKKENAVAWHIYPSTLANRIYLMPNELKPTDFLLPREIQLQLIECFKKHEYAGKNISTIKDSWERTFGGDSKYGKKLNVTQFGFKRFSHAFSTIPEFRLEKAVNKRSLTLVAYLR